MSTIKALVPYQTETFRLHPIRAAVSNPEQEPGAHPHAEPRMTATKQARSARSTAFLVQLMVDSDQDLRKKLGRSEIANAREMAYGAALANRPSAGGLRFLHHLGQA